MSIYNCMLVFIYVRDASNKSRQFLMLGSAVSEGKVYCSLDFKLFNVIINKPIAILLITG